VVGRGGGGLIDRVVLVCEKYAWLIQQCWLVEHASVLVLTGIHRDEKAPGRRGERTSIITLSFMVHRLGIVHAAEHETLYVARSSLA
jgi:hypothetical protein